MALEHEDQITAEAYLAAYQLKDNDSQFLSLFSGPNCELKHFGCDIVEVCDGVIKWN